MYIQPPPHDILYYMLYAAVAMMSLMSCCYLLLRRGNAFAPHITTPARARRWTAAFLASVTMGHLWYLPAAYYTSQEMIRLSVFVGAFLDFIVVFPLAIFVMLTMLQDRRRPLWPYPLLMTPPAIALAWCLVNDNYAPVSYIYAYLLLFGIVILIYMVRAIWQYEHWLRDNYADLEHKEMWFSFLVPAGILLLLGYYVFGTGNPAYEYIVQCCDFILIGSLLWRVETLSELHPQALSSEGSDPAEPEDMDEPEASEATHSDISQLLQEHCIDTQLYLQNDLSLAQLAKVIGTNRLYLSQYFSSQGMTYNTYINDLRISHFISLYHEAVAARRNFTANKLAKESGYRSYSTFSMAFKQRMGVSVTAWMASQPDNITSE